MLFIISGQDDALIEALENRRVTFVLNILFVGIGWGQRPVRVRGGPATDVDVVPHVLVQMPGFVKIERLQFRGNLDGVIQFVRAVHEAILLERQLIDLLAEFLAENIAFFRRFPLGQGEAVIGDQLRGELLLVTVLDEAAELATAVDDRIQSPIADDGKEPQQRKGHCVANGQRA